MPVNTAGKFQDISEALQHPDQPYVWLMDADGGDFNNGLAVAHALSPDNTFVVRHIDILDDHSLDVEFRHPLTGEYEFSVIPEQMLPHVIINSGIDPIPLSRPATGFLEQEDHPLLLMPNTFAVHVAIPDEGLNLYHEKHDLNVFYRFHLDQWPQLASVPNTLMVDTIPTRINTASLAEGRQEWAGLLDPFTQHRPVYGVVLGNRIDNDNTGLALADAEHLSDAVTDAAKKTGGSVMVITSPRLHKPEQVLSIFRRKLEAENIPAYLHDFHGGGKNPYQGVLSSADRLIVTNDSLSMPADALATGKPVFIFDRAPFNEATSDWSIEASVHLAYEKSLQESGYVLPMERLGDDFSEWVGRPANSAEHIANTIREGLQAKGIWHARVSAPAPHTHGHAPTGKGADIKVQAPAVAPQPAAQHIASEVAHGGEVAEDGVKLAGEVARAGKLGGKLGGKFLPVIGIVATGTIAGMVLTRADKAHAAGKLNGVQLAALKAGAVAYTASALDPTMIGLEEGIDAGLKALGIPEQYRFGTTRQQLAQQDLETFEREKQAGMLVYDAGAPMGMFGMTQYVPYTDPGSKGRGGR